MYTTCDDYVISDTTTVQGIQMSHLCQSAFCIWQKIHPTVCARVWRSRGGRREGERERTEKQMQSVEQ